MCALIRAKLIICVLLAGAFCLAHAESPGTAGEREKLRQLLRERSPGSLREARAILARMALGGDAQAAEALETLEQKYPDLVGKDSFPTLPGWAKGAPVGAKATIGWGSAVAISHSGYFLTNKHVIEDCRQISVFYNGSWAEAKVAIAKDEPDFSIIKVEAVTPYFVDLTSKPPALGEKILVAGWPAWSKTSLNNPGAPPQTSIVVTEGIVSGKYSNWGFSMTAPVSSGNSGGPVLGEDGTLRGISVGAAVSQQSSRGIVSDRYFAVSSESISKYISPAFFERPVKKIQLSTTQLAKIAEKGAALIACD